MRRESNVFGAVESDVLSDDVAVGSCWYKYCFSSFEFVMDTVPGFGLDASSLWVLEGMTFLRGSIIATAHAHANAGWNLTLPHVSLNVIRCRVGSYGNLQCRSQLLVLAPLPS